MGKDIIVVAGAGGFIGGHLVRHLVEVEQASVRAVDIKQLGRWYQVIPGAENLCLDLALRENCYRALQDCREIFNLAADMGGMGFIEHNKALCMLSVLINTHLLLAARDLGVSRYFFSSSACIYAAGKQGTTHLEDGLREEDAYPAMPEDGYGWEKLFSERMCRHFLEDFSLQTRCARYHNIYGPYGTWDGGREKAPAAICRKIIQAKFAGKHTINIWGDGEQTRSFTYINDCITGTLKLMRSDVTIPLNIGSDQMVTLNQLVDMVEKIAGIRVTREYDLYAPQGVRGRNSNNVLVKKLLDWTPSVQLEEGVEATYAWIYDQMVSGRTSQ